MFGATSITIFHGKRQFDVLGGWVSKDIFIMTFCVTKWFPENPISKQKILWTKIKKSHVLRTSVFHFNTVLVLELFLNSAFVILRSEVFCKKGILKNFAKFTGKFLENSSLIKLQVSGNILFNKLFFDIFVSLPAIIMLMFCLMYLKVWVSLNAFQRYPFLMCYLFAI